VDFDHGLNVAINWLREALGDFAEEPRYVDSVPGHHAKSIVRAPSARSAYVTNSGSNDVSMYTSIAGTGFVTPIGTVET